jgi:hypothetical protein
MAQAHKSTSHEDLEFISVVDNEDDESQNLMTTHNAHAQGQDGSEGSTLSYNWLSKQSKVCFTCVLLWSSICILQCDCPLQCANACDCMIFLFVCAS